MGADFAAVAEGEQPVVIVGAQALHRLGSENFDPKAAGLGDSAAGQVAAAQPHRKAQVVFNAGAGARLATGSLALDQHCVQPFGRAVDRRRQPGGAAADNHQVIEGLGRCGLQANARRQFCRAGLAQGFAVGEQHQGQFGPWCTIGDAAR